MNCIVRERRAGFGRVRGEFLPFPCLWIALFDCTSRPIARFSFGKQRLVDMNLSATRDDVRSTLSNDGGALVVVNSVKKSASWVDSAPEVGLSATTDFSRTRRQRFRKNKLGDVATPRQAVQRAKEVGPQNLSCARAGVTRLTGELAKDSTTRMTDDVSVLELGEVILKSNASATITTTACCGVFRAQGAKFSPWVFAGIAVTRHHGIGYVMTYLGRFFDLATQVAAEEPIADAHDAVSDAVRR